jgi:uncharacterized protein YfaS (alpha-2-macroglobulin family)
VQKDLDIGDLLNGEIYVENIGEITLYPRLILEGLPRPGEERAASYGMDLQVRYTSLTGDEIDPGKLEQGEDIVTEVTVRHTGSSGEYEEVALSTVFPSGWEIRNQRFDPGVTGDISTFEYQDVRDDRVYTYFDIAAENSKTFRFLVNASYLGRYYLPMITVETMYDASINARVPGRWVDVIEPGSGE